MKSRPASIIGAACALRSTETGFPCRSEGNYATMKGREVGNQLIGRHRSMVTNLWQFGRVPSGTSARKPRSVAKCCDGLSRVRAQTVTTPGPGPQRQLSLRAGADRGKHRRRVLRRFVTDASTNRHNAQSLRGSSVRTRPLNGPLRRHLGGGGGDREWHGTWVRRTLRGYDEDGGCPR